MSRLIRAPLKRTFHRFVDRSFKKPSLESTSRAKRVSPASEASSNFERGDQRDSFENGERARHPKHLKGRDIGLWYAARFKAQQHNGERREKDETELLNDVFIERDSARRLKHCLKLLESEMQHRKRDPGEPVVNLIACGSSSNGPRVLPTLSEAIQASRSKLPVYRARAEILRNINDNRVTVISGETGSGKTTQVPQFILDQFLLDETQESCFIVCTQPRRISAITVAERVAYERGETVGENSVGYKIRLESKDPQGTSGKILYCTTGIILRFLQSDPLLERITHVIVDEVHERSIDSDLLLGVLREKILPWRPDLKVICMSATLDSSTFTGYFGEPCGLVSVDGKMYPVKDQFLEDFIPLLRYDPVRHRRDRAVAKRALLLENYGYERDRIRLLAQADIERVDTDLVVACIEHICATCGDGAILVFMPGWSTISEVCKKLSESRNLNSRTRILPLHSMLPTSDQRRVFDVPPKGVRKIIVSTVIAETSVTIEDVVYVVDSGKTNLSTIDVGKNNLSCLGEQWISKANARQRLGRAGRVQAGQCFKLYTKMDYEAMEDYTPPEMVRSSLEDLILHVKKLNLGEPEVFLPQCMSPPSSAAVENSLKFLIQLKALDKDARLTALGKFISSLPTSPRIGKMLILGTLFGCLEPVLSICAALDFKDPFGLPMGREQEVDAVRKELSDGSGSDHVLIANTVEQALRRGERFYAPNFLSPQTMKMLLNLREQYKRVLIEQNLREVSANAGRETVRAVICGGLYPGIARARFKHDFKPGQKRPDDGLGRLKDLYTESERGVSFHGKSVLAKERDFNTQFFAYFLKQRLDSGVMLFDATAVHPLTLLLFAADCDYNPALERFSINGWMEIHCDPSTAHLISRMRSGFDYVLECFLRLEFKQLHWEFIESLKCAFNNERCEVRPFKRAP